jgi:hypothetical protein
MTSASFLASLLFLGVLTAPVRADETKRALPPKHTKAGLICHDCHGKENPSKAAVADESCMVCHGDYPAMAAYTKHLKLNPHKPPTTNDHPGPFPCTDCHRQHKPQVVKCIECHDYKMEPRP